MEFLINHFFYKYLINQNLQFLNSFYNQAINFMALDLYELYLFYEYVIFHLVTDEIVYMLILL